MSSTRNVSAGQTRKRFVVITRNNFRGYEIKGYNNDWLSSGWSMRSYNALEYELNEVIILNDKAEWKVLYEE